MRSITQESSKIILCLYPQRVIIPPPRSKVLEEEGRRRRRRQEGVGREVKV
jgi:hypothetical protein